jgi:hypothetical protein
MKPTAPYPIGTPGQPWTADDRHTWLAQRNVARSYRDEVLAKLEVVDTGLAVEQYGALSFDPDRYPLFAVRTANPLEDAPWALITGGVHGYETSGVQGALAFATQHASAYTPLCNFVIAPCISPWGYEVVHRWNPIAVDPNRSFVSGSQSEEAAALMAYVAELGVDFLVHVDLHETTDSDESEFRPALAARDGKRHQPGSIPEGFYAVGDSDNPQPAFQAAIIEAVRGVTHIAPADADGTIIGTPVEQPGVINYPFTALGLCAGLSGARFTTTTEVYPDSPGASPEVCNAAQVAAVRAALDFVLGAP